MRPLLSLLLLLLAASACSGTDPGADLPDSGVASSCPAAAEVTVGGACSLDPDLVCFTGGDVCGLSWGASSFAPCRCLDGRFVCDDLYPIDGADCPYPDGAACNREGPGGCSDGGQPSGAACRCEGGNWICDDNCFVDCPASYRDSLAGRACQFAATCSFPEATCLCADDGTIACNPS